MKIPIQTTDGRTVHGDIDLCTPADLVRFGLVSQPKPKPDLSKLDLSGDNWKSVLPITQEDLEYGQMLADQGNLEVQFRGQVGIQKRHPFGNNLMVCSAYIAKRRIYAGSCSDDQWAQIDLLREIIDDQIDKRFKHPNKARPIVWRRLSDTFDKLDDLVGPLSF